MVNDNHHRVVLPRPLFPRARVSSASQSECFAPDTLICVGTDERYVRRDAIDMFAHHAPRCQLKVYQGEIQ